METMTVLNNETAVQTIKDTIKIGAKFSDGSTVFVQSDMANVANATNILLCRMANLQAAADVLGKLQAKRQLPKRKFDLYIEENITNVGKVHTMLKGISPKSLESSNLCLIKTAFLQNFDASPMAQLNLGYVPTNMALIG